MNPISILMPAYNNVCVELVESLSQQAEAMAADGFEYEIVVADDGSTDRQCVAANTAINALPHCRFIRRTHNVGRAAIRNFLAGEARYDYCLFIDSDRKLGTGRFLYAYAMLTDATVACGGLHIVGDDSLRHNIRYRIEKNYEPGNTAEARNRHPYAHFNTSNFFVRTDIVRSIPFDERFRKYGYEDVLWGKRMKENNIPILHIDNPIVLDDFETNPQFVAKIEEGMETLYTFRSELEGYSPVIAIADRINRCGLCRPLIAVFGVVKGAMRRNLMGRHPVLSLFNVYKLGIYLSVGRRQGGQKTR